MSSYVVGTDHIDLIVTAFVTWQPSLVVADPSAPYGYRDAAAGLTPDDVGRLLLDANIVAHRYNYPGTITATEATGHEEKASNYRFRPVPVGPVRGVPFPVLVLAALRGYEYQASEDPDHEKTVAYRVVAAVRDAAVRELPGMDEASAIAWHFDRSALERQERQ